MPQVRIVEGQMLLAVNGAIVANAIIRLNGYIFGTDQVCIYVLILFTGLH